MTVHAQGPPLDFEIVSIKRNLSGPAAGGGGRNLPDGTRVMVNQPIRSIILLASPVQTSEVEGLPDWTLTERYDVTARPPAGSTSEERREMWRRLFAERMQLVAHVEERERDVFDLVVARDDGRLGPNLTPASPACAQGGRGAAPPQRPLTVEEVRATCSTLFGRDQIVSGGTTLAAFAGSLTGRAGGRVFDRTGLEGAYALELTFSPGLAAGPDVPVDDRPDIFTALQEQLGLKLVKRTATLPVFVVDRIERPSDN
jgi:uncharacterized protein (TIGR03435 family)